MLETYVQADDGSDSVERCEQCDKLLGPGATLYLNEARPGGPKETTVYCSVLCYHACHPFRSNDR